MLFLKQKLMREYLQRTTNLEPIWFRHPFHPHQQQQKSEDLSIILAVFKRSIINQFNVRKSNHSCWGYVVEELVCFWAKRWNIYKPFHQYTSILLKAIANWHESTIINIFWALFYEQFLFTTLFNCTQMFFFSNRPHLTQIQPFFYINSAKAEGSFFN